MNSLGFKVVNKVAVIDREEPVLTSFCTIPHLASRHHNIEEVLACAGVEYVPGKYVSAPDWLAERGNHLTVLRTIDQALVFAKEVGRHDRDWEIWACECRAPVKTPFYANLAGLTNGRFSRQSDVYTDTSYGWPCGTAFFKKVRLLEIVFGGHGNFCIEYFFNEFHINSFENYFSSKYGLRPIANNR